MPPPIPMLRWPQVAVLVVATVVWSLLPAPRVQASLPIEQIGLASFYGIPFHGRTTASGEIFDMTDMTAAHRTLPFGTLLRVTNLRNGRSVVVRVNDRGPYRKGRILDLSSAAAEKLGFKGKGLTRVRLEPLATSSST